MTIPETLKSLHVEWCRLTGQELRYQQSERLWYEYNAAGFTEDDLRCVLTFILWHNRKREPKYRDRILFHRIVGDLETLNSRLGEARAWHRNRKPALTDRDRVLRATGRVGETEGRPKHISEVFKGIGENKL